jgi:hypothetical protein
LPSSKTEPSGKLACVVSRAKSATDEIARLVFNISTPAVNTQADAQQKNFHTPLPPSGSSHAELRNISGTLRFSMCAARAFAPAGFKYESFR